jgi:Family of unknown function (DUF5999)
LLETSIEEHVMSAVQTVERPATPSASAAIPCTPAGSHTAPARLTTTARQSTTGQRAPTRAPCGHQPRCPGADAVDRYAARVVVAYPEQGWSLLCNGVISFEDTGALLPDGTAIEPHRRPARYVALSAAAC